MTGSSAIARFAETFFDTCEDRRSVAKTLPLQLAEFSIELVLFDPAGKFETLCFEHLVSTPPQQPGIDGYRIYIIDWERYPDMLPAKCWSTNDLLPDFSIAGFSRAGYFTSLEVAFGNFLLVDTAQKRAIQVIGLDHYAMRVWEYFQPLRKILNQFVRNTSYVLLHSSALAWKENHRGILFIGSSGAGKSTLSGICVSGEIGYAGDDFVLVNTDTCRAYCLYTTLKVREHVRDLFDQHPIFKRYAKSSEWIAANGYLERASFHVPQDRLEYVERCLDIVAMVRPVYDPEAADITFTAIPPAEVLKNLAFSTFQTIRGNDEDAKLNFHKMSVLAKKIPGHRLRYTGNIDQTREATTGWLRALATSPSPFSYPGTASIPKRNLLRHPG